MKKILLMLLLFISVLSFTGCYQAEIVTTATEYSLDLEFIPDYEYNLSTGIMNYDEEYAITKRIRFYNDTIELNDYNNTSYILFWNNSNYFIGFYTLKGSIESGSKYLDTKSVNTIEAPEGASKIAFMIEYGYTLNNLIEDPDFSDPSNTEGVIPDNWYNYDNVNVTFDEVYEPIGEDPVYELLRIDCNQPDACIFGYYLEVDPLIVDHIYYITLKFRDIGLTNGGWYRIYSYDSTNQYGTLGDSLYYGTFPALTPAYTDISTLFTPSTADQNFLYFLKDISGSNTVSDSRLMEIDLYDITATYTAGLEPDIEEFELVLEGGGSVGVTYEDFLDLNILDTRDVIIEDDTTIGEDINNNVDFIFNIEDDSVYLIISLVIIIISIIGLFLLKGDLISIIVITMIEIFLFYILGWIPSYILLMIGILAFLMISIKLFRGGRS